MNRTVGLAQDKRPRLLVFIVAYNAETTISTVLRRIPDTLLAYDTEVLIIDDASQDNTFEKGHEAKVSADLPFKLNVLFNPVNQGYGGNQKIGYHYAIRNNFDLVVLLHGDGQYAPEMLPDLVTPIISGEADAVFGSRMLTRFGALKGGMPIYKYVGNKILTKFQNFVLGLKLSEFHSGYRAYSIDALSRIPFHLNTNEFHFDTEIIIQLALAKRRIKEIPIPTYYGDEISRVNGLKYAKEVFKTTLVAWIQNLSLLYHRKFDVADPEDGSPRYEAKMTFDSSHTEVVKYVDSSTSVLDLGCGVGYVAKALSEKGCRVTGVDIHQPSDTSFFLKFIEGDLNDRDLEISLAGLRPLAGGRAGGGFGRENASRTAPPRSQATNSGSEIVPDRTRPARRKNPASRKSRGRFRAGFRWPMKRRGGPADRRRESVCRDPRPGRRCG